MKDLVLELPRRWGDLGCNAAGAPHEAPGATVYREQEADMKGFVLEVPLRWGDMDATPQAFHMRRPAPWRPGSKRQT